jgi:cbb3-type cytochrome oxidase maturation protein
MIDFFFLVPIAIGMGLAGLASFMWTLRSGQYDDLEGAAQRILFESREGPIVGGDPAAVESVRVSQKRRPCEPLGSIDSQAAP